MIRSLGVRQAFLLTGGRAMPSDLLTAVLRFALTPFRNGRAPLDAQPCCYEAAFRLYGRCNEECGADSLVYGSMESWAETTRQSRVLDLKTSEGRR